LPKIKLKIEENFGDEKETVNAPQFTRVPPRIHHQQTTQKHALFRKPPAKNTTPPQQKKVPKHPRKESRPTSKQTLDLPMSNEKSAQFWLGLYDCEWNHRYRGSNKFAARQPGLHSRFS
jgi:hypothetical protein